MSIYRRMYLCACPGKQETMYLKRLQALLNAPPKKVVTFNANEWNLNQLDRHYADYDKAFFFDFDFHEEEFRQALLGCQKLDRKPGRRFMHAYSSVCFDLWLLLHKRDYGRVATSCDAYQPEVRKAFGLRPEADIKKESEIKKILDQISLGDVRGAIRRTSRIREAKLPQDAIRIGKDAYYPNPDFSIHAFLEHVLKDYDGA